ncbi:MAG: hypothetical protein LBC20_16925 [Planctomycetaceae bacterium]|jgi:hypothetical protein|nr:hypothetical protein [Planctomycetaceae bacterium]
MILLPDEREIFYSNFLGLLSYVNDKYKLIQNFGHPQNPAGLNLNEIKTLKDKLWSNVNIIDEYIDSTKEIPDENVQIIQEWKKKISGRFIMMRHLKKYSIFLDDEHGLLYGVNGIQEPISAMIPAALLPIMVEAVLLPFGDMIIYDGILCSQNIQLGPNIRKWFKGSYTEIKKEKGIIVSIK